MTSQNDIKSIEESLAFTVLVEKSLSTRTLTYFYTACLLTLYSGNGYKSRKGIIWSEENTTKIEIKNYNFTTSFT